MCIRDRGVLVNEAYEVVAAHSAKHEMENPQPNHFEQDAEAVWWNDFCKVSKGILQETGIDPRDIAGVGADVLGCDCLPVDENCRPLRKAILYGIDARASEEIAFLNRYYGPERVKELFEMCIRDSLYPHHSGRPWQETAAQR